jgi:hypothetical protein
MAETPAAPVADPPAIETPPEGAPATPTLDMSLVPERLRRDTPEETWKAVTESYGQLEQKLKEPKTPPVDDGAIQIGDQTTDLSIEATLAAVGTTMEEVAQVAADNDGKLSDDLYAKLGARGLGRTMVDEVIGMSMRVARSEAVAMETKTTEMTEILGGEQAMAGVLEWAKTSLTPAERESMNARLKDPALMVGAAQDLASRHAAATGRISAGSPIPASGAPASAPASGITAENWAETRKRARAGDAAARAAMVRALNDGSLKNLI